MVSTAQRPNITQRLNDLRRAMKAQGIDAWIIPSSDAHNSEYVASHWEGRAWISGFNGSAGTVVITAHKAALWTDGRYFLQASEQLEGSPIALMKQGLPEVATMEEWLADEVQDGGTIGFDGATLSLSAIRNLQKQLAAKNITLKGDEDLLNSVWTDRPALPANPIFLHSETYSGKSLSDKIAELRDILQQQKVTDLLITTLDDIAWLFNLRGSDIECNPVFLAYALISSEQITLFVNQERIEINAMATLAEAGVKLAGYDAIADALTALPADTRLLASPNNTSYKLASLIPAAVTLIEDRLPTTDLKAIKNSTEIERMKECHRRDGAAMVRFMCWLDDNIPTGKLNEVNIDEQLTRLRSDSEHFKGVSFPSIVGYAGHGAIIHYRADEASASTVNNKGLLLIDSGAQYPDGTTDITRTVACGEMSEEEKRDYTMVLKSHIALAMAKFRAGTRGIQLDAITRQPLWNHGMDFNHGTGHGVGYFLNVHEGPQSISPKWVDVALEPGMLVTNEPGIYREGKHGIRLENIMLVAEDVESEFGKFYRLTPLTLAPFDTRPLIRKIMMEAEIQWLNEYHAMVRKEVSTLLQEHHQALNWLEKATAPF